MKPINLTEAYKKYKGLWIAFTHDYEVISAHKDIRKVAQDAAKKGYNEPIFFKMPRKMMPFIGSL